MPVTIIYILALFIGGLLAVVATVLTGVAYQAEGASLWTLGGGAVVAGGLWLGYLGANGLRIALKL